MKRIIPALLLTLLLILSFSAIQAADSVDDQGNPNDPAVNEHANACYEGGTLEGKCDSDLLWGAGWYLIRFEHGLLSRNEFPGMYLWVLPPEVKQQVTGIVEDGGSSSCTIEIPADLAVAWGTTAVHTVSIGFINGTELSSGDMSWYYQAGMPPMMPSMWFIKLTMPAGWTSIWYKGAWTGDVLFTDCPNPTDPVGA